MNYLEAAKVIEEYIATHKTELSNKEELALGRAIKALKKLDRVENKQKGNRK